MPNDAKHRNRHTYRKKTPPVVLNRIRTTARVSAPTGALTGNRGNYAFYLDPHVGEKRLGVRLEGRLGRRLDGGVAHASLEDPFHLRSFERGGAIIGGACFDGIEPAGHFGVPADDDNRRLRLGFPQFGYGFNVGSAEDDLRR